MMQAVTDYRMFVDDVTGVYINIGMNECGLFSRKQYEELESSNYHADRHQDWD